MPHTMPIIAPAVVDRFLYAAGTLLALFTSDRLSRHLECGPLPALLARAALALYLLQVIFVTVFLQLLESWARSELGPTPGREDGTGVLAAIYALSLLSSLVVAALVGAIRAWRGQRAPDASVSQRFRPSDEIEA
uniref:Uncharacterized protein n=1 Tax=Alexandrium monilatum TaxID=311494 RepID=A0A7S4W883_9DINO